MLHRDKPISMLRFRREARIVAQLAHPHIAEIYEFSEQPPFIAMRFIEGVPIDRAESDRITALRDVARAVHCAHEQGVIHRDLKPANILVDTKGHAYVLDFGIAKRITDPHELTRTGNITGTPAYMAPEQALGAKTVDARTDVYGLGATLYQILTGRPPHVGESAYQIIRKVIEEDPDPTDDRELGWIAMRAMAKEPSGRYASAAELADDLDRFLARRPIIARPPSLLYRARKVIARHPLVAALSLLLLLATATLIWIAGKSGEEWVTVIREDFSQEQLGAEWKTLRGSLALHDGALCSRNGHAVFDVELGDRVRVDFSAVVQPDSSDPRELSAFISGSRAAGLANGYSAEFFILDDFDHAFHGITRLRSFVERTPSGLPERGRTHRLTIERTASRIGIEIDGARVVEIDDPAPLTGPDHNRFGIGSKCDHLQSAVLLAPRDPDRMVLLMKRLMVMALVTGCGLQEYEFLEISSDSNTVTLRCPTGETVTLENSGFTDSPYQLSRACIGLDGTCDSEILSLEDPRCSDVSINRLRGTCVEEFFSCFGAGGMCTTESDGIRYSTGARWTDGLLLPPDSDEPCIIAEGNRYALVL